MFAFDTKKLTGLATAAASTTVPVASKYRIQVEVTGTPTAGTLSVGVKTPGASSFATLSSSIDLVNGPLIFDMDGPAAELEFTPSGFNGTSFDVIVNGLGS